MDVKGALVLAENVEMLHVYIFWTKSPYIMRLTISCCVSGRKIQFWKSL